MPEFNGKNIILPAVEHAVDTTGIISTSLVGSGEIAIIGPAEGGLPYTEYVTRDPAFARNTFRGGDLVDAALQAWSHGAGNIHLMRIGSATQSTITLASSGDNSVIVKSQDFGEHTNNVSIRITDGTNYGKRLTIQYIDPSTNKTTTEMADDLVNAQALITWINESSNICTAELHLSGHTYDILDNISLTSLTGGDNGSYPTVTEWRDAFDLFRDSNVNIMHPAGCTDESVHILLLEHCKFYSSNKKERICVVGGDIGESIGDYDQAGTTLNRAYNLNSGRAILVAPGTDGKTPAYTASKITGMIANVDVATPLTFKKITSTSIEYKYPVTDKEKLATGGVLTIEQVPQGYRIIRGITTAQDLSATTEDPYKEITIQRIADYIGINIRNILEGSFIGKKGIQGILGSIISTTTTALLRMKDSELILDYREVNARKDPDNPKIIYVDYFVLPIQPINWIFVTTKLTNS